MARQTKTKRSGQRIWRLSGGEEAAKAAMSRVLRAEDVTMTNWAMENIRSGLAHRDRAFYR